MKLLTFSNNICTIGNWYHGDILICCTIERPWLQNKVDVSCIPAATYTIKPINSPHFGLTYEVCDVAGRTHILIHKANRPSELRGCIAPVSRYGILSGEWAGLSSKPAYDKLMTLLAGDEHELEIKRY
jgi:hypothetical protein